jgi:hypothetical protein
MKNFQSLSVYIYIYIYTYKGSEASMENIRSKATGGEEKKSNVSGTGSTQPREYN